MLQIETQPFFPFPMDTPGVSGSDLTPFSWRGTYLLRIQVVD